MTWGKKNTPFFFLERDSSEHNSLPSPLGATWSMEHSLRWVHPLTRSSGISVDGE